LLNFSGSLNCGYAKLQEARRLMAYFRQSGKKIIGYCSGGAEKELYFALGEKNVVLYQMESNCHFFHPVTYNHYATDIGNIEIASLRNPQLFLIIRMR
jgi:hypothetical protein